MLGEKVSPEANSLCFKSLVSLLSIHMNNFDSFLLGFAVLYNFYQPTWLVKEQNLLAIAS